jgi:hypothetical protein
MILHFYEKDNTLLCDFSEGSGRPGELATLLFTYELTKEIKETISKILWLDDLPLTVPAEKFEAFLSAVGYSRESLASSHGFWNDVFQRTGVEIPLRRLRNLSQ